ncbi:nuclear transport factor 2 family protein [Pseudoflavitalea sp. G-6-1-2]|uniref:nuclear transport factor 2 family protein n=1 Tax=Pseudoflavitalea sp. G-6-1-2 TaxID=2728841 RepID=UPI00146B62DD|nr:nuclear transport factor 2 family protein [Pseudoflavitalea sp. G-6-1-2]NML23565.1 nuclear transport factor 2 family protein [Pseudoflavitalea sp. G-6-1-2]
MKKISVLLSLLFCLQFSFAQGSNDEEAIRKVLDTFMDCIIKRDSTRFYPLFHKDPVSWAGSIMPATHQNDLKRNEKARDYFASDYKSFIRSIYEANCEEKFYNIRINHDGYAATVFFDYSFWLSGKKLNWGAESWGMIKTNGEWKIVSVIFSVEEEAVRPEPQRTS